MSNARLGYTEPASPSGYLDLERVNVDGNPVDRERVQITGTGAAEIGAVKAAEPASDAYGLVTRLVGMATLLGHVDGIETLLTTLNGLVDGLEALLAGGLPAALSGTGGLKVTPLSLSSIVASGTQSATTSGAALPSQACSAVIVQADDDNTVDVYVGGSASQDLRLTPGASLVLPLDNVSDVYVKTLSSTATVRYNALT